MAGPLADEGAREMRYRKLVRRLVRGGGDPAQVPAGALRALGRSAEELLQDVEALQRRFDLFEAVGNLPDLEARCELAEEGYRVILESAAKARAEAAEREARARAAWSSLRNQLRCAREAEEALRSLLPAEGVALLEARREQLEVARQQLYRIRREGRNTEHAEAAVEQALLAWRSVRDAVDPDGQPDDPCDGLTPLD
jgi:hypothetical protein